MASPTDLSGLKAWYKGEVGLYDATVGGSAVTTDEAVIKRWEDQSGNGWHLTQGTSATAPVYDAVQGAVVAGDTSDMTDRYFAAPASMTLNTQNFGIFLVCEVLTLRKTFGYPSPNTYQFIVNDNANKINFHLDSSAPTGKLGCYDGSFHYGTTVPLTTTYCLLGVVGTAGSTTFYLDGVSTSGTALASATATLQAFLGQTGGAGSTGWTVKDLIIYDGYAPTAPDVTNTLFPYAQTRGVVPTRQNTVVADGDSLSVGKCGTMGRNWMRTLTIYSTVRRRNCGQDGITLATLVTQAASFIDPFLVGGETNIEVVWAGTNDIAGGATGAATFSNLLTYCAARRSAGWKIIVVTMIDRTGVNQTERGNYNTSILADANTHWDATVNTTAASQLEDNTNATYFCDNVHLTNAGIAIVAGLINTKVTTLLPVPITQRRVPSSPRTYSRSPRGY